jgi:hypothetical protein
MKNRHVQCIVCKEWKPATEFTAVDVCDTCLKTHDKYGRKRSDTNEPNEKEPSTNERINQKRKNAA